MIDEQHAVEMIDLMLDTGRQKPLAAKRLFGALDVNVAHIDDGWTLHLGGLFRDRQAAFFKNRGIFRAGDDFRIDHLVEFGRVIGATIHDDQTFRHIDLRRGEANAGRVIHRLDHVVEKPPDSVRHLGNRRRHLAQHRIGNADNGNQRHRSGSP